MLKNVFNKVGKSEKGFTLIEMLVVVGIIVALAAVIVPTVIKFSGGGEQGAKDAEWDAVQSAIDIMMSDNKINAVADNGAAAIKLTDSTVLCAACPADKKLGKYLRDASTKYCYTWDTTGRVLTQPTCP